MPTACAISQPATCRTRRRSGLFFQWAVFPERNMQRASPYVTDRAPYKFIRE